MQVTLTLHLPDANPGTPEHYRQIVENYLRAKGIPVDKGEDTQGKPMYDVYVTDIHV